MTDLHDHNGRRAVIDRVQDSVVTLSETVFVLAGQLLGTGGSWISTKPQHLGSGALPVLLRQRFELLRG